MSSSDNNTFIVGMSSGSNTNSIVSSEKRGGTGTSEKRIGTGGRATGGFGTLPCVLEELKEPEPDTELYG